MGRKPKQTLLEKALSFETKRPRFMARPSWDEIEVAMAWLSGKITDRQAQHGLGLKSRNISSFAGILRRAYKLHMIEVRTVDKKR